MLPLIRCSQHPPHTSPASSHQAFPQTARVHLRCSHRGCCRCCCDEQRVQTSFQVVVLMSRVKAQKWNRSSCGDSVVTFVRTVPSPTLSTFPWLAESSMSALPSPRPFPLQGSACPPPCTRHCCYLSQFLVMVTYLLCIGFFSIVDRFKF